MSNRKERAATMREKAEEHEEIAEAFMELCDEVVSADTIGDTKLSELFYEVRTSRSQTWRAASAFINVVEGEAEVEKVLRIREGNWSPETKSAYDMVLSVGVVPFIETERFRRIVEGKLREKIGHELGQARKCRSNADWLESRGSGERE